MGKHDAITALVRHRIEDLTDETGHRRTGPLAIAAAGAEIAELEESLRALDALEEILLATSRNTIAQIGEELEK